MKITIELCSGINHNANITKQDIQKNIDALRRAIDGKSAALDFVLLLDTKSILECIKEKLPNEPY